jgi:abortive infection alpha-like protein
MSNDLIPISDEQAKLGQEGIKLLRGLGAFFEKALGSTPEDLIGYLGGDRLRVRRAENMARMLYEAKAHLEALCVEETVPATLNVALPILEAAADEDRDEIVDLWARLYANAMNPKLRNVRYSFIEAVKRMDPPDALVLRYLHEGAIQAVAEGDAKIPVMALGPGKSSERAVTVSWNQIARDIGFRISTVDITISNLVRAGFLQDRVSGANYVTGMFYDFMLACYPEMGGAPSAD